MSYILTTPLRKVEQSRLHSKVSLLNASYSHSSRHLTVNRSEGVKIDSAMHERSEVSCAMSSIDYAIPIHLTVRKAGNTD